MKYSSKKDLWLTIVVWGAMLFTFGSSIFALLEAEMGPIEYVIMISLGIGLPVFIMWMWFTTYYVLTDDSLIIRYGPFKKAVPFDSITSVKKTSNPFSSPALSMKRLEILYGKYDIVLISPENRDTFMELLRERCPHANI
ncbi:PH domain-containing protein [Cytobacillus suaedae]|nr:PH domain-containing protein [Cytobacillus suaedae]